MKNKPMVNMNELPLLREATGQKESFMGDPTTAEIIEGMMRVAQTGRNLEVPLEKMPLLSEAVGSQKSFPGDPATAGIIERLLRVEKDRRNPMVRDVDVAKHPSETK